MKQNNWNTSCAQNGAERARETMIWRERVTEKVTWNAQPGACVDVFPRCWWIQGEGPGGPDPPYQTWPLFETKILTSTRSYITLKLADFFFMIRALNFATKLNSGIFKKCNCFGYSPMICSPLLAKKYFPRNRRPAFTDWEARARLYEK